MTIDELSDRLVSAQRPGHKRRHMIVEDMAEWEEARALVMLAYGIHQAQGHDMPGCGIVGCVSPTCMREGQTIPASALPKPIKHASIWDLLDAGEYQDVIENLDSLAISVPERGVIKTGMRPVLSAQVDICSAGLFDDLT